MSEQNAAEYSVPTFQLDKLPDLSPYAGLPNEIYSRYSQDAYVDTLQPASDYGQLYPYVGKTIGDYYYSMEFRYGLVDARGRIVVDPVYSGASFVTNLSASDGTASDGTEPGAYYLCLSYPIAKLDEAAKQVGQNTGYYDMRTRYQFAKADGTWVSPIFFGNSATLSGDRVIVSTQSDDPANIYSGGIGNTYQLYDLQANLIAEGAGDLNGFSDGLSLLRTTKIVNGDFQTDCYYIDKNGRTAITGPFSSALDFKGGKALVAMGNDTSFAVIDTQGNYLAGPEQLGDRVDLFDSSYMTFWKGDLEGMIDRMGNIVLPAIYDSIDYNSTEGSPIRVVHTPGGVYSIANLQTGEVTPLNINCSYAYTVGGDWVQAAVWNSPDMINTLPDNYLIRGDKQYIFSGDEYGNAYIGSVGNDIFAINNSGDPAQGQFGVTFFNADTGEPIKSLPGWNYYGSDQTPQGQVHYLYGYGDSKNYQNQKITALSADFEPLFTTDEMADAGAFSSINYLKDGLFSVRTDRFGGLMRADGSWLIRVVAKDQN